MSKTTKLNKPTNSYIVLQQGGLQNGRVVRASARLRVGAKNPKEAIEFCKEQISKTHGYHVYYREIGKSFPRGSVLHDKAIPDPLVEMDGEIYIRTNELEGSYVIEDNGYDQTLYVKRKYVKRYARNERDVKWVHDQIYYGSETIRLWLLDDAFNNITLNH